LRRLFAFRRLARQAEGPEGRAEMRDLVRREIEVLALAKSRIRQARGRGRATEGT